MKIYIHCKFLLVCSLLILSFNTFASSCNYNLQYYNIPHFTHVEVAGLGFSDDCVMQLANDIVGKINDDQKPLSELAIIHTKLTTAGFKLFNRKLSYGNQWANEVYLSLYDSKLTGSIIAEVVKLPIVYLDLSYNQIGDNSLYLLVQSRTLDWVRLWGANISDVGAKILATNHSITKLELESNHIGDIGAITLASATNLTQLDLRGNHISDAGAFALVANHYDSLDLSENNIGNTALVALKQAHLNSQIKTLNLKGNPGCSASVCDE